MLLDLQISGAGHENFVFSMWLRSTHTGKKYAIFALNSLNLHRAPVSLVVTLSVHIAGLAPINEIFAPDLRSISEDKGWEVKVIIFAG